jgi:hypothetical protein
MTISVNDIDEKCLSDVGDRRDGSKQPLPTPDHFRRAHESLWMRAADLAAYEFVNHAYLESCNEQ